MKRAWERLAESTEIVGRVSEMRSAWRHAIDDLKLTPEEAAKFHTTVGNAYRIYAEQQADALLAMPKDKAAAKLKKDLETIRELAAPKMR